MNKTYVALGVAVLVLAVGVWWERRSPPVAVPPQNVPEVVATSTVTSTSSTPAAPKPVSKPQSFSLAPGEVVSSWDFKGLATGNAELEKKAHTDIDRLNAMFGTEGNTDYILNVSIAAQYDLLGDGAREYEYLLKALAKDPKNTTGLAWYNLGTLLSRLNAFRSARVAYAKAVVAQPDIEEYQTKYFEFLTQQFPKETAAIEKAFASVNVVSYEQSTLLQIHARWLEGQGRIKEAIADWQKVKTLSPDSAAAVDIEIQRLQSEL